MTMTKENKKAWTQALRSGEYKQGQEVLCNATTGKMCCLGVAIDVLCDGEWLLAKKAYSPHEGDVIQDLYEYVYVQEDEGTHYAQNEMPEGLLQELGISVPTIRQEEPSTDTWTSHLFRR